MCIQFPILIKKMASFKKKCYTDPVISNHQNEITVDRYVFFRFKHEGKEYKYKRREGINRIKNLQERLIAIEELLDEIMFDLHHGWNLILDPKRQLDYNPYLTSELKSVVKQNVTKRQSKIDRINFYLNK